MLSFGAGCCSSSPDMHGLVDDLQCTCWEKTLAAEGRGELRVFSCPVCVTLANRYHGGPQLSFFPKGERERSVSALLAPEDERKKAVAAAWADSLDRPF